MTDYHEIVGHSENFLAVILFNLLAVGIYVVWSPNYNITCDLDIMLYFFESRMNSLRGIRSTCYARVFYPLLNIKDFRHHNVRFHLVFSNIEFFLPFFLKDGESRNKISVSLRSTSVLQACGYQVLLLLLRESQFLVHHISTYTPSWHICVEDPSC